jgi:hypothetical protein
MSAISFRISMSELFQPERIVLTVFLRLTSTQPPPYDSFKHLHTERREEIHEPEIFSRQAIH